MRLARYKRNRGVYKCQTFGTLQPLLVIEKFKYQVIMTKYRERINQA